MTRARLWASWIVFGLAVTAPASAQTAYTTKSVNVRAGPSRDYPLVARIPGGMAVEVNGCLDDWTWCDVTFGLDRGWVYAGNLDFPYEGRRVVILEGGGDIGFPIVTFSVGPYWDTYYRGRPWYGRRSYWFHRPPPPHHLRPARPRSPVVVPPHPRPPVGRPPVPRPPVPRPAPRPEVVRPRPQPPRPQPPRPAPPRPKSPHDGH